MAQPLEGVSALTLSRVGCLLEITHSQTQHKTSHGGTLLPQPKILRMHPA
jgi:hypothetical protein